MIDVQNKVLTTIANYLISNHNELTIAKNFTSTETSSPTTFPTIYINSIGATELAQDMENDTVNAITSIIEVQVFTQNSLSEAKKLANEVCDAMKTMRYNISISPYQSNINDNKRVVSRFRRVVCSLDEL